MWDRAVVPLGIEESLRTMFSALLTGGIDRSDPNNASLLSNKSKTARICYSRFVGKFTYNIFYNNYAIFYELFVTLGLRTFSVEQVRALMDTNKDLILDSPYIDKSKYAQTINGNLADDDDILEAITEDLIDCLVELSQIEVTEDEFGSACEVYTVWYKTAYAESIALDMSAIMSDAGFDDKQPGKRTVHLHGLDDMVKYYNNNMRIIKSLSEEGAVTSTVVDSKWFENEMKHENQKDNKALFPIGLPEIDATVGDLRRGNMLGIMGPPKGGKTRFANFLVEKALKLGYNVCVWPLEGTEEEWLSMQTSCYMAETSYNELKSGKREGMIRISSGDILDKKYLSSNEMRKQVAAAKKVIATSEKQGRLSFMHGTAYVEDMFDQLQAHYDNENPFDVLVIDQLVNVMSRTGKGKVERISEAYMQTKNFIANVLPKAALGIMPCQLKQEVVDFLRRNPDETIDVTAGGETAETVRTPDQVIGLFSSKEERANNIMKIYSVASRHNEDFPDFQAKCYLECCFFLPQDDSAV